MFSNLIKSYLSTKIEILLFIFFNNFNWIFTIFSRSKFFCSSRSNVNIQLFVFGNSLGNGWRPDKGLGYSSFYGDSSWHPWSFYLTF